MASNIIFKELISSTVTVAPGEVQFYLRMKKSTSFDEINVAIENLTRWPAKYRQIDDTTILVAFRPVGNNFYDSSRFKASIMAADELGISKVQVYTEYMKSKIDWWL